MNSVFSPDRLPRSRASQPAPAKLHRRLREDLQRTDQWMQHTKLSRPGLHHYRVPDGPSGPDSLSELLTAIE